MSTTSVPAIDYTARDFLTIREALKQHLINKFPDTWRDFYESNAGIALLELIAYVGDVLSFQLDYTANEMFLPTARDRLSVLLLGRLAGYQMRTATSASVQCTATLPQIYTEAIVIPAGTTIDSRNGTPFLLAEDARIAAGAIEGTVDIVQGENQEDEFSSDGTSFQKFQLTNARVIQDTIEVLVDGDPWDEVESLVYADGDTNAFQAEYDEEEHGSIVFGDGTSGRVPPSGAVISVSYRIGGGVLGNVATGEINGAVIGYREGISPADPVSVSLTNAIRGSGGEDRETITHAKLWIPRWIKANSRAVTEEDFDALANTFSDPTYGAPAYAKARLKQEIPELNTVEMSLWARDGEGNVTVPSEALKNAVEEYFNNNGVGAVRTICTTVEAIDGNLLYVDVDVDIKVATDYSESDTLTQARQTISDLFDSADVIPGADYRISVLYNAVHDIPAVEYCVVRLLTASYRHTETVGVGDGLRTSFSSTLDLEPGLPVVANTVRIFYGSPATETLRDDGEGNIINETSVVVGSIDYDTGAISFSFLAAPPSETLVYAQFRAVLDYQRSEQVETGDGTSRRFRGSVSWPPVNPYDPASGLKGIVFSDGNQTVIDDGDGNLTGDVDPSARNTVDYSTGAYDFTFAIAPGVGEAVNTAYRQELSTGAQDIPVDKDQIAVEGLITVSAL